MTEKLSGDRRQQQPHSDLPDVALDPWDASSAEALMSLYEAGAPSQVKPAKSAVFFADPPEAPRKPIQAATSHVRASLAESSGASSPLPAQNSPWLENLFAEMTNRIEHSVNAARPEASLNLLATRLDQLEKQFDSALEKVATRTDVEGLRIVEAHITELTSQIADAQKQLQRLETIESHLQDLSAYAAAAGEQPATSAVAPIELPDFSGLADSTADSVLSRLAGMPPKPSAEADNIDQIQHSLQSFINEHRQQSQHTAGALDTMQDVLINLIDRVEALQMASTSAPSAALAPQQPNEFSLDGFTQDLAPAFQNADDRAPLDTPPEPTPVPRTAPIIIATPIIAPAMMAPDVEEPAIAAETPPSPKTVKALAIRRDLEAAAMRAKMKAAGSINTANAINQTAPSEKPQAAPRQRPTMDRPATTSPSKRILAVFFFGMMMTGAGYFGWRLDADGHLRGLRAKFEDKIAPTNTEPTEAARPASQAAPGGIAPRSSVAEENSPTHALRQSSDLPPPSNDAIDTQPAVAAVANVAQTTTVPVTKTGVPMGIAVQFGPTPRAEDAATRQLNPATEQPAATPASLPGNAATRPNDATASLSMDQPGNAVEMPPATVGPLSLRLAAQRGDPGAEFEVAARLAEGKGVKQDFKLAMTWFQRAANHGLAPAQYRLGTLYERGLSGTKPDLQRARIWYKRAADQGNVKAMHNLAVLSAGRESGKPDYATAAQWFTEAADRGLADSQFNLGVLYENGLGVTQDTEQAYKWFALAVRGGDKEASKRRDQLATKMPPAAFASAEQLVAAWRARPSEAPANDPRIGAEALRARGTRNEMQPPSAPPAPPRVNGKTVSSP
jgi:localization factor PodJL